LEENGMGPDLEKGTENAVDRLNLDVDIACVGFGPAMGGFLTTLAREMEQASGEPHVQSTVLPGMPLQVVCYERADDVNFGVSGLVTEARAIRNTFPEMNSSEIPLAHPVSEEKIVYLLDPHGASRRSLGLRIADSAIRGLRWVLPYRRSALELPFTPPFLKKHGGLVMSIGQFMQWVSNQVSSTGMVQIWPGTPVGEPILEGKQVVGVRIADQGVQKDGTPDVGYMPGMDVRARLTVVGDGPVGAVGQRLDEQFGLPEGHHQHDWAVGMKMVVNLPDHCDLVPGTVLHTLGYPEPEIFGFLYVHPERIASLGIFVPSTLASPVRTVYRYLQHWMLHPYLWHHLEGGTLRSWGAKTLQESGRLGEPYLAGDGYARIGEGSGSTNVLTGSGVDEAWMTGVLLAEGVIDMLKKGEPFTQANLDAAYVNRRRKSWVETGSRKAQHARDGFRKGFVAGVLGMAVSGLTRGALNLKTRSAHPREGIPDLNQYYRDRISSEELQRIREECAKNAIPLHDALMTRAGWPEIPLDGKLLVSQQDALLLGGKVQAAPGYADHVVFVDPAVCEQCGTRLCIETCSAQAITPSPSGGTPEFDREKCIHCGACIWNCTQPRPGDSERGNIRFAAGAGGLHSAEN